MNIPRLSAWLRRRFSESTHLQLVFISQNETEEAVQIWGLKEELADFSNEQLAELIISTAQEDTDIRGFECRYACRILDANKEILSATVLKQKPSSNRNDPLDIGSAATNGAIAQLVRMNEVMLRMYVQSIGSVISGYNSLMGAQTTEIAMLRKREAVAAEIIQQATAMQLQSSDEDGTNGVALTKLGDFLENIAPLVLDRLGIGGIPGNGGMGNGTGSV